MIAAALSFSRSALSPARWRALVPGTLLCVVVALAATFLSEHLGGPQLVYALLLGLSLHFVLAHPALRAGVDFSARTLLRAGVALLGARLTFGQVEQLGALTVLAVMGGTLVTIGFGLWLARWLGRSREEGLISGCGVGICGASAALAVSSVLPQTPENERLTLLSVVGVTLLSTLAMVVYPLGLAALHVPTEQGAIFLGASMHDVAQVVGAGMMIGPGGAELAALVKLMRVLMLLPITLAVAAWYRQQGARVSAADGSESPLHSARPPLLPGFLVAFVLLMLLASLGWMPPAAGRWAGQASGWLLVVAIAAAGVKTTFRDLASLGWRPMLMLLAETLVIASFAAACIALLGLPRG